MDEVNKIINKNKRVKQMSDPSLMKSFREHKDKITQSIFASNMR